MTLKTYGKLIVLSAYFTPLAVLILREGGVLGLRASVTSLAVISVIQSAAFLSYARGESRSRR